MKRRWWIGCSVVTLAFAGLLVSMFVRSCAPSNSVKRGDFVISVWPNEMLEYFRFPIISEKAGEVCIDTLSEDYKQMTIAVLLPTSDGFTVSANDPVAVKKGWIPRLRLANGEYISVLSGAAKLMEKKKQLYFSHASLDANQQPKPEDSAVFPILSKDWPRREVLPDGDGMIGFHLVEQVLHVHHGKGTEIDWEREYPGVLDLAPVYVDGKLTYALIKADGAVQVFNRSSRELESYSPFPTVPEDLRTALKAKRRQVCFAGDMLVWRSVRKDGVNEYHIGSAAGEEQILQSQDEFAARSIFRIIPKIKDLEEAARSDPEVSNFILRKDGRRQPADVVASGTRIMPLDEETIVLVDNNYQRITTIRKAD